MFTDGEHKFTVHEHKFTVREHKFTGHKHKKDKCVATFMITQSPSYRYQASKRCRWRDRCCCDPSRGQFALDFPLDLIFQEANKLRGYGEKESEKSEAVSHSVPRPGIEPGTKL